MNNNAEMKVTYIDPNDRALYVAELPTGGFGVWAQKGKAVPRKLQGNSLKPEGYPTFEDAQEALIHHVDYRRSSGPSLSWGLWKVYVNGIETTWDDYHAMCRNEIPAPMELPPNAPVSLANIEYRIALHIQGACENLLEVGHCLQEAKDSELVPHGEWEGWVRRNTDMSLRQAQRLMQAARSVKPGSMMEKLPITKIQALLALPEPEREPMAEKTVDESLSLRELQAEVKKQTDRADQAEVRAEGAEKIARYARETAKAKEEERWQNTVLDLTRKLDEARKAAPAQGISEEAQTEIERLQEERDEAIIYAEEQSRLRQEAQREKLEAQTQNARGETQPEAKTLTAYELASAVRVFIGTAGVLPLMGKALAMLGTAERAVFREQLEVMGEWVEGSTQALSVITQDDITVQGERDDG